MLRPCHYADFDTTTKLLSSMWSSNDILLPHLNYRGPVNFLLEPLPKDIRQRIVSKLPRLQDHATFLIPHPHTHPLVINYVLKANRLLISFFFRILALIVILNFLNYVTGIGLGCMTSFGLSLFLPNIRCTTAAAKIKGYVAC